MPRLTIDKTTETFDREIGQLTTELMTIDTDVADLKARRVVVTAQLATVQSLRAALLDDATDDDNGQS